MKKVKLQSELLYIFFILYIIFANIVKIFFLRSSGTKVIVDYMMILSIIVCELILIASFFKRIVFRNRSYGIKNIAIKLSFVLILAIIAALLSCYIGIVYKYIDRIINKLAFMFNIVYVYIQGILSNTFDINSIHINYQYLYVVSSIIMVLIIAKAVFVCFKYIRNLKIEQKQIIALEPYKEYHESEVNYLLSAQNFGHLYKAIP